MPWFKKKVAEPTPTVAPEPVVLTGTAHCSAKGCTATNAVACAYVDRRQRACTTAWCPAHQIVINGACFCRRHANTMDALGNLGHATYSLPLPDIENRMPTLVRWISMDLDEQIHALLDLVRAPQERFNREAVHSVKGLDGVTRWILTWQLYDHTGSTLRITIEVDEREPMEVHVRVGLLLVFDDPPWIKHRTAQKTVDPDVDLSERTEFYTRIVDSVNEAIQKERASRIR